MLVETSEKGTSLNEPETLSNFKPQALNRIDEDESKSFKQEPEEVEEVSETKMPMGTSLNGPPKETKRKSKEPSVIESKDAKSKRASKKIDESVTTQSISLNSPEPTQSISLNSPEPNPSISLNEEVDLNEPEPEPEPAPESKSRKSRTKTEGKIKTPQASISIKPKGSLKK